MKILLIPILLTPLALWSQTFTQDISALNSKIGQDQLDAYLKAPTKAGVPGPFFNSLVPNPTLNPQTLCTEDDEKKKSHYEVVLIAEGNAQFTSTEILPGQRAQLNTNDLRWLMDAIPESETSKGMSLDSVTQRASDIWNSGWITTPSKNYDPKSPLGQELFVESLVRAAAKSDKNENDLARDLAGVIAQTYKTDQEKYSVLSAFSLRLYRNYNTARNPGYDNPKNNPFDADLPAGDINLNNMLKAAADFNVFQGGVCNDITESVIQVGQHLFPDKDVLAVNSGTHFGVLIADGKTTHIIDGGDELVLKNNLKLDPKMSPTNLRISKMENGALKEIAVVDTEMGQMVEGAFNTGKHLLKTDADISSIYAHLKKNNFGVTVGTGKLSDSSVVIVVAKYENIGDKWKSFVGVGGTAQSFDAEGMKTKYQVHFKAGVERSLFRYINNSTAMNFSTGTRMNFMYLLNPQNEGGGAQKIDMSAGLDWYNRFDLAYGNSNPNGIKLKTYVEVEHTVGPSNWGNTTGAMSFMEPKDTGTMFKNMTFHLNQVNADVMAEKKVGDNKTAFVQTHYQGSNIGQSVSVLGGMNINAPNGAQILVFTGYTKSDIGGFKTQNSLLSQQTGLQLGAKYTTKSGIEFGAGLRGVAGKPAGQVTIKVPLGGKKK